MTFEEWKDDYGLVYEPNYCKETEADCKAAFKSGAASRDVEVATLETRLEEKTEECQSFYEEAERVVKERDQLREHLEASRANDRTAMMYLSEIKAAAAHEGDFPSLVLKVAQLREQVKLLRDVILKQMESENRWPDYIIEALATAKHLGVE